LFNKTATVKDFIFPSMAVAVLISGVSLCIHETRRLNLLGSNGTKAKRGRSACPVGCASFFLWGRARPFGIRFRRDLIAPWGKPLELSASDLVPKNCKLRFN
jgi:hypothetical protein